MSDQSLSKSDYRIFSQKSLLWVGFGWVGFLLALSGFFHAWIVWAFYLAGAIILTNNFARKQKNFKISKELMAVSAGFILLIVGLSIFTTPSVFSGRDQGSISEAAIRLAQNHSLTFSTPASNAFFEIRGTGRALNFPGFFYDNSGNLITQFPLVYISWLASFYGIFGLTGLVIANAVLSLLFLFTFYFLARSFMPIWSSIISIIFATTSLSIFWLPKYTLSENLALPLVWLSIFSLTAFLKSQNKLNYSLLLTSSILLIFTRIEGIAFFLVCGGIALFNQNTRSFIKKNLDLKFLFFLLFILLVFVANFAVDINFYKEIVKAILPDPAPSMSSSIVGQDTIEPRFYMLKIFQLYGMLGFFALSAIACIFFAIRKDSKKLIPLFVIAPTLIYLFDSHISPDQPWMLRRFAFSILPGAILYSSLLINDLSVKLSLDKKKMTAKLIPAALTSILLIGNIPAFLHFATFSENKNLLEQTKKFGEKFSSNDLVLIDNQATGDGWSMISGPMSFLYGKNSAYFFNPSDLDKLDLKSFKNVYLIAPDNKISYYENSEIGNLLTPSSQYEFSTSKLSLSKGTEDLAIDFPEKKSTISNGTIFSISKKD